MASTHSLFELFLCNFTDTHRFYGNFDEYVATLVKGCFEHRAEWRYIAYTRRVEGKWAVFFDQPIRHDLKMFDIRRSFIFSFFLCFF